MGLRSTQPCGGSAVPDLTTTVLTLSADRPRGRVSARRRSRTERTRGDVRIAAIVTMFTGAALGAWLLRFSPAAPLALGAVLSASAATLLL